MKIPASFRHVRRLALALGVAVTVSGQAAVLGNPPIRMAPQGVEYMCGGSGEAEAAFMEMVAPRWSSSFQFAMNADAHLRRRVAGVKLLVRDAYNGYPALEVRADAPHLLARLAPGSYKVEATLDGVTLMQPLNVVHGIASRTLFVWPSNLSGPVQTQAALQSN